MNHLTVNYKNKKEGIDTTEEITLSDMDMQDFIGLLSRNHEQLYHVQDGKDDIICYGDREIRYSVRISRE